MSPVSRLRTPLHTCWLLSRLYSLKMPEISWNNRQAEMNSLLLLLVQLCLEWTINEPKDVSQIRYNKIGPR